MAAILIAIASLQASVLSESLSVLTDERNMANSQLRMAAIDRLHKFALLDSDSIVNYYQAALQATLNPVVNVNFWLLVAEMCAHPNSSPKLLSALCGHIEQWPHLLPGFLKTIYSINKIELVDKMRYRLLIATARKYSKVYDSKSSVMSDRDLRAWLNMCICRSILRDQAVLAICEEGLRDKRVVVSIDRLSQLPNNRPLPTRVCDYCVLSMLYYSQADILSVFNLHGMRDLKDNNFRQANIELFDDVIKNRHAYINMK